MVSRLMLASFGLVPRHMEIAMRPPSDEHIAEAIKRLILAVQKRERRVCVSSLIRSNLGNAASVWSATGGHSSWLLHLTYLADAVGKKLSIGEITKRANSVPQILAIPETAGNSVYTMAVETDNGGNSGIDTIMRTLAEKRLIEDRAPTLDGSWMQRIMDARSANGHFLHSTMTPFFASCGARGIQGNVCIGGVSRLGGPGRNGIEQYDKKLYLAVYYLGAKDLQGDLLVLDGVLDRLKRKVTREDLYYTWLVNWQSQSGNGSAADVAQWNKPKLWDYLVAHRLLRMMVVVAGAGPRAAGMPELHLAGSSSVSLGSLSVLVTDGRVAYDHDGISIAHVVPEAFDGGGLAAIRTGDWLYLDLNKGDLQVVQSNNHGGYKIVAFKDLMNRPDRKRHIHEIEKQRMDLLPSFRVLLDNVSTADAGVSPSRRTN
jgi:dihydroxyacid dehydratase/phosphogluconate dehydratase